MYYQQIRYSQQRMLCCQRFARASLASCVRVTLQYGKNDCTVPPVFIPSSTLFWFKRKTNYLVELIFVH